MTTNKIKLVYYSYKDYNKKTLEKGLNDAGLSDSVDVEYLDVSLNLKTAGLAAGKDGACIFVNDIANAEVLTRLSQVGVKLILLQCAGFDNIDLTAAKQLGLNVVRVPAYSPYAVAEFAATLLMTLNRKVHRSYARVRDGNFTLKGLLGFDLHGKTVGVVGTGKIGQCFINIMLGFGCNVLCYDVYQSEDVKKLKNAQYVQLEKLLKESDIISLHIPSLPSTINMINSETINLMKPGVLIINTARGNLIDSKALLNGLLTKRIGGAGLDVYHNEKPYFFKDLSEDFVEDDILVRFQNMPNVILTAHQAFLTYEALLGIANTTCTNIREYFLENKREGNLSNAVLPSN